MNALSPAKAWPAHARRDTRYPAYRDLVIVYEGYNETIPSRPPDLSPRGMFINTARYFPEGAVLKLRFRLGRSNEQVEARGEVRYCLTGLGIGVEFIDISPAGRAAIERELEGHRRRGRAPGSARKTP